MQEQTCPCGQNECRENDHLFWPRKVETVKENPRFNYLLTKWYVVVNDLVGGFSVSHVNKPLSEQDWSKGEGEIADFMTREMAEHIVALHNNWYAYEAKYNMPGGSGYEHDMEYGNK